MPKNADNKGHGARGWYAREWLKAAGKKQADVCRLTGWSKGRVSELVSGEERYNADVLEAFAKVCGCTTGQLLDVDPSKERLSPVIMALTDLAARVSEKDADLASQLLHRFVDAEAESA